jgi:hypothetical protein
MDGGAGGCDLACQTKIVLNGGNAAKLIEQSCEALQHFFNNGGKLKNSTEVISLLNSLEDSAVSLQKLVIKSVGYEGTVGKLLQ